MEQKLFERLIAPLGYFKRIKNGTEHDQKFIAHPTTSICEVCNQGWEIWIEKKRGYKDIAYWRYKCPSCKTTWQKNDLKID